MEQNQVQKYEPSVKLIDIFPYSNIKYDNYYNLKVNNFCLLTNFLKQVRSSGRPVFVECG